MKRKRIEAFAHQGKLVYESSDSEAEDLFDLAKHIRGFVFKILSNVVHSYKRVWRRRLR